MVRTLHRATARIVCAVAKGDGNVPALDRLIPTPRLLEEDHIDLAADPAHVWHIARHADLARSPLVHALFALRTAPSRFLGGGTGPFRLNVDDLRSSAERPGFQILDEQPLREVTLGAIGKVWRLDIPFVHVEGAEAFSRFAEPDYVKVAWALRLEPRGESTTRIHIDLRVGATDDAAWRKFQRYFILVGPGSRFIRRSLLGALARDLGTPQSPARDRPLGGWGKLAREIAARGPFTEAPKAELTTGAELAALPPAARSLMDFYGVQAGQPRHWSFRVGWRGRFRMAPTRPWMPIEAIQYDTRAPVARFFHMRVRMNGILPVLARDTYVEGRGRMLGKVADLVTVVDGRGPEFDKGELVTWLNDCVMLAPALLLGPSTRWSHIDARSFDVSLHDHESTVMARVFVDERGAPINFETTDRFVADPDDPNHRYVRCRWTTPVESWQSISGRTYPARCRASWHLPRGEYTYAEFDLLPEALAFDVLPLEQDPLRQLAA
jgi:hypothetical protein